MAVWLHRRANMRNAHIITIVLATWLLAAVGCKENGPGDASDLSRPTDGGQPQVTINGHQWNVELATTPEQRYLGMSGRKNVPTDTGMLFIFQDSKPRTFVMRDCYVPLDIAFINSGMLIVAIHTMAVELNRAGRVPYESGMSAKYALEVAGDALGQAGVAVGDRVTFSGNILQEQAAP